MLLIDNDVVKRVLTMRECIEAQERAFAGTLTGASVSRPRIDMFVPCNREDAYYRWGSVEGASDGVLAVRLKSDIMIWPQGPDGTRTESKYCVRPGTFCGLVLLFSTGDGEPLAILNDGHLQHMRVGASAAIGARLLARTDAHAVGMIGSGGMAQTALEALVEVRDIRTVKVYSRVAAHREAFARRMTERLRVPVEPVASAREAVRGADILVTCTGKASMRCRSPRTRCSARAWATVTALLWEARRKSSSACRNPHPSASRNPQARFMQT